MSKNWTNVRDVPSIDFQEAVFFASSLRDVCELLGFSTTGRSRYTILQRIEDEELDISHLHLRKPREAQCTPALKRELLLKRGNYCEECGLPGEWNGRPLVLHLEHIDGDRENNSRDNLRLLCPNCHSQTNTYARNKKNGSSE